MPPRRCASCRGQPDSPIRAADASTPPATPSNARRDAAAIARTRRRARPAPDNRFPPDDDDDDDNALPETAAAGDPPDSAERARIPRRDEAILPHGGAAGCELCRAARSRHRLARARTARANRPP
ncbi:MAG: hypothetical protein R3F11_08505 [Verrucomicrobiales bacterium]